MFDPCGLPVIGGDRDGSFDALAEVEVGAPVNWNDEPWLAR